MMTNACDKCKKYFPNNRGLIFCPICRAALEDINDNRRYTACEWNPRIHEAVPIQVTPAKSSAKSKPTISVPDTQSSSFGASAPSGQRSAGAIGAPPPRTDTSVQASAPERAYRGVITSYEYMNVGEQNFFERVSLFFRNLHYGYTRHIITFVDDGDNQTYHVCFYGEFTATSPAIVHNGERIAIGGRPSGSTFYSEDVYIGENGGRRIRLKNQTTPRQRTNPLPVIVTIAVLLVLLLAVNLFMSGDIGLFGEVFETFLTVTAVSLVLGVIFLSRRIGFRAVAIVSVVIGVLATIIFYNIGGLSSRLGALSLEVFSAAAILGLTILGIWKMFTAFIGRR